jgi:P2X purinoceptor 4
VIQIEIIWNCNYDFFAKCLPKYTFRRFDSPFFATKAASGFNFRFADKFIMEGKERRVLYKAYGLRFIITVTGTAGRFSIVPFMLTIGAGVGLMSMSVLIADCVMLYCTKEKKLFKQMKSLAIDSVSNTNEDLPVDIVRI